MCKTSGADWPSDTHTDFLLLGAPAKKKAPPKKAAPAAVKAPKARKPPAATGKKRTLGAKVRRPQYLSG